MIKFGTDGWRAKIAEEFTFENVQKVSLAVAKYIKQNFKEHSVIIGYDTRFLSGDFAKSAAKVFQKEGIKVLLSEKHCPTPAVSFFISVEKLSAGIAITASHNPYYFNGYKIREWFGGPASPETTSKIEKIIEEIDWEKEKVKFGTEYSGGEIKTEDIISPYLESVRADSEIDKFARKIQQIVFDVMHGACAGLPKRIFGKKAIEVRSEMNPLFPPYGKPEPTPYTLGPLQEACKKSKSDGFAFDGDGDRIYACTKTGQIIDAHRIFATLIEHLAKYKKQKGKVYKTVTASDIVDKVAQYWGYEIVTTPVGFKHLIKGMLEDNAIIAGEESGGIGVSSHLKERDSLFCACLFLVHSVIEGKSFGDIIKNIEKRFGKHRYVREDFHISDELKENAMEKAKNMDKIWKFKVEKIETLDGAKIRFKGGGFLLVRPSGTEPVIRIYAETESEEDSRKIIKEFCKNVGIQQ